MSPTLTFWRKSSQKSFSTRACLKGLLKHKRRPIYQILSKLSALSRLGAKHAITSSLVAGPGPEAPSPVVGVLVGDVVEGGCPILGLKSLMGSQHAMDFQFVWQKSCH